MAEEQSQTLVRPRRGGRGLSGAIILILAGVVLLLQNLGAIHIDWLSLWHYWPVLLILIGLDVLLGRSIAGSVVVALLSVVLIGALLFFVGTRSTPSGLGLGEAVTRTIEEDLGGAEALTVEVDLGAADAQISALRDEHLAASGELRINERLQPHITYRVEEGRGYLTISEEEREAYNTGPSFTGTLKLALNSHVPLDLTVHVGVGDLTLDLSGLTLRSLTIEGGVGTVTLILPSQGAFSAEISAGVGSLDLTVPSALSALIEVDKGLSSTDVPSVFVRQGENRWATPAYSPAEHATIRLHTGVGSVDIHSN